MACLNKRVPPPSPPETFDIVGLTWTEYSRVMFGLDLYCQFCVRAHRKDAAQQTRALIASLRQRVDDDDA